MVDKKKIETYIPPIVRDSFYLDKYENTGGGFFIFEESENLEKDFKNLMEKIDFESFDISFEKHLKENFDIKDEILKSEGIKPEIFLNEIFNINISGVTQQLLAPKKHIWSTLTIYVLFDVLNNVYFENKQNFLKNPRNPFDRIRKSTECDFIFITGMLKYFITPMENLAIKWDEIFIEYIETKVHKKLTYEDLLEYIEHSNNLISYLNSNLAQMKYNKNYLKKHKMKIKTKYSQLYGHHNSKDIVSAYEDMVEANELCIYQMEELLDEFKIKKVRAEEYLDMKANEKDVVKELSMFSIKEAIKKLLGLE